jgi:hypothetical protein
VPITLTLTDDQALDIVAQISDKLRVKNSAATPDNFKLQAQPMDVKRKEYLRNLRIHAEQAVKNALQIGEEFTHRSLGIWLATEKVQASSADISRILGQMLADKTINPAETRGHYLRAR